MLPGKFAGLHFLLSVAEVSGLRYKQCVYIIYIYFLVLRRPETSATVRI